MKKVLKNIVKKSAIFALSLSMIAPVSLTDFVDVYADEATQLIKEYDFEKGFREIYDTDTEYKIVSASGQYVKKTAEQRESSDRVDANEFVIQGEGANTKYYTQSPGNQPAVKYDDEKGTVFFLAGTFSVPELVKELPANIEGDAIASEALDALVPVGTVVREAATFKSAMTFTNPFKSLDSDSAVLAFWGKVPANSTEEKIAFIEFSNDSTSLSFSYDASVERGTWHYYVYVIGKDSVTAYLDGNESTLSPVVDGTAPEDMVSFVKNADIYFGATNVSSVNTVEETVFDDVRFYNGFMSYEDARALYNTEYEEFVKTVDLENPLAFMPLNTTEAYENLNAENPSMVEKFNINGHEVEGIAVVENTKGDYKNGIKIESPFKGLRLEGATIGYWIQVEPKANIVEKEKVNNPDKGYTGKYPNEYVINETVALSFMDTNKVILNPKHNESAEGFSYLYTKTRMQAYFEEGGYFGMNTGNQFEADSPDDAANSYVDESRNWHYMTVVVNNDGVSLYCDGKLIEGLYEMRAPRFLDGYYRRVGEREKISTLYGAFGGSGNQLTSQIMSFLSYEDTDMYFGWLPLSEYRNETTSPVNITRMTCYADRLSEEEVASLYNKEVTAIESLPEYVVVPEYIEGDMDADEAVTANDALIVLKIAAKLEDLTDEYLMIGDMIDDETLDASDALHILKIAAKLI